MKKIAPIIAALAIASISAPMYYTFTGKVIFVAADEGGYAAAHGIRAQSPVSFVFVVDTARLAYNRMDGTTIMKPDTTTGPGYSADYFFDSLITPSLFSGAIGDNESGSFLGYRTRTDFGSTTHYSLAFQTIIGNPDPATQLIINIPDSGAADWMPKVGQAVAAVESYTDSTAANSSASMTLTLTAISAIRPAGVRPAAPVAANWLETRLLEGSLLLENRSGRKAMAKVRDASGKTVGSQSIGEKATLPLASLPRGELFLEVTAGAGRKPARLHFVN
jgi:hypothetical protein